MKYLPVAPIAALIAALAVLLWTAGVLPWDVTLRIFFGSFGTAILYAGLLSLIRAWKLANAKPNPPKEQPWPGPSASVVVVRASSAIAKGELVVVKGGEAIPASILREPAGPIQ